MLIDTRLSHLTPAMYVHEQQMKPKRNVTGCAMEKRITWAKIIEKNQVWYTHRSFAVCFSIAHGHKPRVQTPWKSL